ncbi:MAG: WecB/TagA/CpsF family glycosyltransferase [Sediminibacterium sp.]|nr:WecB/TagA/CpsF family glycosyltransferase [Sediminibacterium sp.]
MVKVLGLPIYDGTIESAVAEIVQPYTAGSITNQNRCISATGAHGIIEANQDPAFKEILQAFYCNLPDGMPTVWVARLKGAKKIQRCYGPDFFKVLIKESANKPINHFLCGGKEGVADALKEVVHSWGNHNVVGTFCPPFREITEGEWQEIGTMIQQAGTHIVWIGLSTPKQEKFAWKLTQYCKTDYIITVGAAFDFHTGTVNQAPKWMQQIALEWLFRLIMEPRRLYKRYLKIVPLFIWLNIKEFIDFYILKKY